MRTKLDRDVNQQRVATVLSGWHLAAAHGLFDAYFDAMTDDAVFLGTDASERWTKSEFMGYAREPFADGHGWEYKAIEQHIELSDDHQVAWVDELLKNEKYGILRGTGVLVRADGHWKIAQYSLTFLIPNEIAGEVVELIVQDD